MALAPGTRLGPYALLARRGIEGPSERWRARDTRRGSTVSIRVFVPESGQLDPAWSTALDRIGRFDAILEHANISPIREIRQEEGVQFLVQDYLAGETLGQRIDRSSLPIDAVLAIAVELASALELAHRSGFVHGGLDPSKIVLEPGGPKVVDFGLPRVDLGRPCASPEERRGETPDRRSDVHAFGAILREMIGSDRAAPPALERAIARCLAADPEERWQSTLELLEEMRAIQRGSSEAASSGREREVARIRRELVAWTLAGATGLASLTASFASMRPEPSEPVPPAEAAPVLSHADLPEARIPAPAEPVARAEPPAPNAPPEAHERTGGE